MLRPTNSTAAKSASGAATSAKNDARVAMNIAKAETAVLKPESGGPARLLRLAQSVAPLSALSAQRLKQFVDADLR
jgi:hypothetical protein